MKQPRDSLFFQSALYVAELSDPVTVVQFLEEEEQKTPTSSDRRQNEKISKLEEIKEVPTKIIRLQKNDPYQSDWAQVVLARQFGVQLSQTTQCASPKWILKKVKPHDFIGAQAITDPKVAKDFKSQERLFQQTASQSHRKKINKIVKQYQQSFNGPVSNHHLQTTTANYQQKLPSIQ